MKQEIAKMIPDLMHCIKDYSKSHFDFSNIPKYSHTQMKTIVYVFKNEDHEINQKELEQYLRLQKSSVSSLLDTLEKQNVIHRVVSKTDARKKIIVLDEKTKAQSQKMEQFMSSIQEVLLKDIDEEKLQIFCEVISQMQKNLTEGGE